MRSPPNELRAAIVRGELEPGAKILQEPTAQRLGVSLIPLREALKTLAAEGILSYLPQRGYFVTELRNRARAEKGALSRAGPARGRSRSGSRYPGLDREGAPGADQESPAAGARSAPSPIAMQSR